MTYTPAAAERPPRAWNQGLQPRCPLEPLSHPPSRVLLLTLLAKTTLIDIALEL